MKIGISILIFFLLANSLLSQQRSVNMNRNSFLFVDTLFSPFPEKQNAQSKSILYRLDSVCILDWNVNDSAWINNQNSILIYDSLGRVHFQKDRSWNGMNWINQYLREKSYNSDNQIIWSIYKSWDTDHWNPISQNLYSRLPNGNIDYYFVRKWDHLDSLWKNSFMYEYGYDNEGNWTSYLKKSWNSDSVAWISDYRFLYTYEYSQKTEMKRQNWNVNLSVWENSDHILYTYDSTGILVKELSETWDADSLKWDSKTLISYVLYDQQVREKIYQDMTDEGWSKFVRYSYQYDPSGKKEQIVYFIWNKISNSWDERIQYLYNYLESGDISQEIWQNWNAGSLAWINDLQVVYSYSPVSPSLEVQIFDSSNISCFGAYDGWALATVSGGTPPYTYQWDDENMTTDSVVYGLRANRWYHLVVTDATFSVASDSIMLSQPELNETGPVLGDTLAESGSTYSYSVLGNEGSFYTWAVRGGIILSGQGTPVVEARWDTTGLGNISVFETDSTGCIGDTSILSVLVGSVGILEEYQSTLVRIFPNPFRDELVVEVPRLYYSPSSTLQVMDLIGRICLSKALDHSYSSINLGGLPGGIYLVKISYAGGVFCKKVLKK